MYMRLLPYHSILRPIESLLPLQGDTINDLIPRALPWAIVTLGFQPAHSILLTDACRIKNANNKLDTLTNWTP